MMWAKQSTAATVIIGPVLDSTGAEYASAVIGDLSISKNGGTLTALASAATLTLIANGQYTLVLTTSNLDTLGRAQITCNKSTYQMPSIELMVLPSTVFDALVTTAVNATGGLVGATAAITAVAGYIGASGAAVNGSNINTLSGHDPGATLGTSTLTQTQVTGGAYAINNASFAFNAGLDFTTTMKAATLARVTLVDTTTTNTDMRGTNSAALAATALSTAQWTNTLATNIGTTNTTVAANLDATVSGRMATYTQPTGFLAATFPANVASTTNITAATGITVSSIGANVVNASALAADAVAEIQSGLALAATALSTTQWTNTLATNIGTTNTTVAANLDATVSSRLASASYTAPSNLTAAQIATGIWQDATPGDFTTASSVGKSLYNAFTAGTSVFTVAALVNAPSGGGGGSATLANQTLIISTLAAIKGAGWDGSTDTLEKIRDAITAYISSAVGSVQSSAGTIVGFPSTLTIGDSYTQDANRAIVVYIRDAANAPVLSVGSHNFLDGDFAPELVVTQGGETGRVHATVTYVVPGGILENYLRVEFSPKETRRAGQGAATMQCRLKWTGVQFTLATQSVVWLPSI